MTPRNARMRRSLDYDGLSECAARHAVQAAAANTKMFAKITGEAWMRIPYVNHSSAPIICAARRRDVRVKK